MTQETQTTETNNSQYTAADIQVLGGREAVRRRPSMYIGSTDQRGLHHLLYEIVYNSIDEAMAGFCTRIQVTLEPDGVVQVEDNGRGIPVEVHPATGKSALETVMTVLHAGAKFGGKTYVVSGGLHGVGASVVNALSSSFRVKVRRDGKEYQQEYRQGIPQGDVQVVGEAADTGTTVTFLADKDIFTEMGYDTATIRQRLREMAYLNKGLEITLADRGEDTASTFYFEGGIASFVHHLNHSRTALHSKPIYINRMVNSTIVEVALQYNDGFAESVFSFANCINTMDGGTHLTGFRSALTRVLNDYAHRNKFLKEDEPNLVGDDVREGLTGVVSVKLHEPQFEGQTKGKLGNIEIKGIVETVVSDELALYLEEHPDEARSIIDKCLTAAKAREAARKARDLILKKSSLEGGTLPGKLADCSEKDPALCEVFLVEGDSAGGSAKQGRNRRFQAILPLRGKILNVEKAPPDKMLAHEEIRAMITALGTGIDDGFDLAKLRYHKVILMTDADVDGAHIRTLLLTFFFRHMVKLIHHGHLYIAQPPLYRVAKGKTEDWVHSEEEMEQVVAERTLGELTVYSKDRSITITGKDIRDLLHSLKELGEECASLERNGVIPQDFSRILLMKDESFYRLGFSTQENAQEVMNWFVGLGYHVRSDFDPMKKEYSLEVNFKDTKLKLDRRLFENPLLHKCFKAYPRVERYARGKEYIIARKGKEIKRDIPWYELADALEKGSDKSGVVIQRYKGLGEMSAEQLWATTMNRESRTLLLVTIEDAAEADHIFTILMGDEVTPRKNFIQAHAKSVKNLDI
ncbi:MAG: DNA topoisomerase (ATP-hydrolyzing) subunit B [Chloroflexota bacterium]